MDRIKVNLNIGCEDSTLNDMKKAILNDPEILSILKEKHIGEDLIDKYVVKIYDFMTNYKYCKNCPGKDKCAKDNPYISYDLSLEGNCVDLKLEPCGKFLEEMDFENRFIFNDMKKEYRNASLKNVDKGISKVRMEILSDYLNFVKGNETKWMYFKGALNTGKTYLASAFANDLASREVDEIVFIDCPFRFKELYDYSFNDLAKYSSMLDKIRNAKVLILDDFGNELKNDFIRDGILGLILSSRADKRKLTIFTSEYSIDDVTSLYSYSKASSIRAKQLKSQLDNYAKVYDLGDLGLY